MSHPNVTSGVALPVVLAEFFGGMNYETRDPEARLPTAYTSRILVYRMEKKKFLLFLETEETTFEMVVVLPTNGGNEFIFMVFGKAYIPQAEELAGQMLLLLNTGEREYHVRLIRASA